MRGQSSGRVLALMGAGLLGLSPGMSQAQAEAIIAQTQVLGNAAEGACPVILMILNNPATLASQRMSNDGMSLRVVLTPSEGFDATAANDPIETRPVMIVPGVGTAFITIDRSGRDHVMTIRFSAPADGSVAQSGERSLVISLERRGSAQNCLPSASSSQTAEAPATSPAPGVGPTASLPPAPLPDGQPLDEAATLLAEARSAITNEEYPRAVQILTNIVGMPDNASSADAQELLGLARERNGQLAHAQAEYEIYLEKYPEGEAADRVRQRLAAIVTAQSAPPPELRAAGEGYQGPADELADAGARTGIISIPRRGESFPPLGPQPGRRSAGGGQGNTGFAEETLEPFPEPPTFQATVALNYYLNQSSTLFTELDTDTTDEDNELLQNDIVLSLDMSDEVRLGSGTLEWRMSGEYEVDVSDTSNNRLQLSRVFGEYTNGEDGPTLAFGRQSRRDDGLQGRFDGVHLSYPIGQDWRVSGLAGLDVESKSDMLFSGNSLVGLAAATYSGLGERTELTGYLAGQTVDGFTDRFAVGIEGSHATETLSMFGQLDYDVSFGRVNLARLSYNQVLGNLSSFSVAAEYRHSPLLSLSTALQGQTATTLDALSTTFTDAEIQQLAQDRTSEVASLSIGYQRPLNDTWQSSVEASVYSTTGTPASGGVDAVAAPGEEYYLALQAVGSGIIRENDVISLSSRVASNDASDLYLFDTYWRFDMTDTLRLRPRLRMAHRVLNGSGGTEDYVLPSLGLNLELDGVTDFELEAGTRLSNRTTPDYSEETNEVFINAGVIRRF